MKELLNSPNVLVFYNADKTDCKLVYLSDAELEALNG